MTHLLLLLESSSSRFLYPGISEKTSIFFESPYLYWWTGSLALIFLYYFLIKKVAARHRKSMPLPVEAPPRGLSPSAMRYLFTKGFDTKALIIGVISAAQKGCYGIIWKRKSFMAIRNPEGDTDLLSPGEKAALYYNSGNLWDRVTLSHNYTGRSHKMGQRMDTYYKSRFKKYFARRRGFQILGILLSIASVIALFLQMPGQNIAPVLAGYLLVFGLFLIIPTVFLLQVIKDRYWYGIAYSVIFFVVGITGLVSIEYFSDAPLFSLFVIPLALLNFLFISGVSGYTRRGQLLANEINGYREYLKHRFERIREDDLPLREYAREIPYAMALDIDYAFTPYFHGILSRVKYEPFQIFDQIHG